MPSASDLKHKITLQRPVTSTNDYGEKEITYADVRDVWAAIHYGSGQERFRDQRVSEEISHRIIIRHDPEISSSWRAKLGDRIFDIRSIDAMENHPCSWLILHVTETI